MSRCANQTCPPSVEALWPEGLDFWTQVGFVPPSPPGPVMVPPPEDGASVPHRGYHAIHRFRRLPNLRELAAG